MRHAISSGLGFVVVVATIGVVLLGLLLVRKKHEYDKVIAEKALAVEKAALQKPHARSRTAGAARLARCGRGSEEPLYATTATCGHDDDHRGRGEGRRRREAEMQASARDACASRNGAHRPKPRDHHCARRADRKGAKPLPRDEDEADDWVRDDEEDEEDEHSPQGISMA